ncbi:MAG: DUF448 domain-containing protein [Myxococcota bacterium]
MSEEAPAEARRRGPERTCVGCGEHCERDDAVRLVQSPDGAVVVDLRGRLPGRGAWVHPTSDCLGRAAREPRRLSRAFKAGVRAPDLEAAVRDAVLRAVLDQLSLAAAGGGVIGGHDAVELGLRNGRIVEVIFASNASERTVSDILRSIEDRAHTTLPLDTASLGARIGQAPRAVIGLAAPGFRHLRDQLRRLRSLG